MDFAGLVKGIGDLAKAITGYFNPSAYEARVLRGLVGTGDDMAEYAEKAMKGKPKISDHDKKRLDHFIRKWKADRSKLR